MCFRRNQIAHIKSPQNQPGQIHPAGLDNLCYVIGQDPPETLVAVDINTILSDPADRTGPDNRPARLAQPGINCGPFLPAGILAATDEPGGDDGGGRSSPDPAGRVRFGEAAEENKNRSGRWRGFIFCL